MLLCMVLIGSRLPKRHIASLSAQYSKQPEQLFGFISGSQAWRSDVKQESTEPGPAGKLLHHETNHRGRTVTYEYFDVDPPRGLIRRIAGKDLPFAGTWAYSLEPSGTGTHVTITEDGEIPNPAFRFLSRFVFGQTRAMNTYLVELGRTTGERVTPVSRDR